MPHKTPLPNDTRPRPDLTPEGRREQASKVQSLRWQGHLGQGHLGQGHLGQGHLGQGQLGYSRLGASPAQSTHWRAVLARVVVGVWQDGSIHAGNLAYMSIVALFPFFVVIAAIFSAIGEDGERAASIHAFLGALPPVIAQFLEPVARGVASARHGWLLWAGGVVGLWTVSSLIETLRDILRRAYGTKPSGPFWQYRLFATGMIVVSVVLLLAALYLQVSLGAIREFLAAHFRYLPAISGLSWLGSMLVLFGAIYLLFLTLTPASYRAARYPKWPGAALVTLWWTLVSQALPILLHSVFKYDLTYGNLAGVMITLFFFWLVGLGMVTGAELNAALATSPEERDMVGQADNRARDTKRDNRQET